jgi:hypothetical protein
MLVAELRTTAATPRLKHGDQRQVEDRPDDGAQGQPVGKGQGRVTADSGEAIAGQDEPPSQ